MRRQYDDDDDDSPLDRNGLLKDGHSVRVPLSMRDSSSVQRAVAGLRVVDGQGGTRGLSRPGFRIAVRTSDAMSSLDAAYRDYEQGLTTAYKTPPGFGGDPTITGIGERGSIGQREGDLCTRNGYAGVLRKGDDGQWYCDIIKSAGRRDGAPMRVCPDCAGSGHDEDGDECEACNGTGYQAEPDAIVARRESDSAGDARRMAYDSYEKSLCAAWRRG
jgi:hypothetical protein